MFSNCTLRHEHTRCHALIIYRTSKNKNLFSSKLVQGDLSSIPSTVYSVEDHVYEEIAELDSDKDDSDNNDDEEDSFFTLISSGRRNNLRYYGCTSWDFGTEVI